jgi:scavenger receptor class B, member 1
LFSSQKNATGDERFTIYTGQEDINQLGIVAEYNNEKMLRTWKGDECNRLDGSEGSMFPPPKVASGQRVFVFLPQLCRRMPFVAERHLQTNGMPAVRYSPPEDVFDNERPENQCYCNNNICPPKGIFDIGPCTYGQFFPLPLFADVTLFISREMSPLYFILLVK